MDAHSGGGQGYLQGGAGESHHRKDHKNPPLKDPYIPTQDPRRGTIPTEAPFVPDAPKSGDVPEDDYISPYDPKRGGIPGAPEPPW